MSSRAIAVDGGASFQISQLYTPNRFPHSNWNKNREGGKASIVRDPFHVVAAYGRLIDRARMREYRRASAAERQVFNWDGSSGPVAGHLH